MNDENVQNTSAPSDSPPVVSDVETPPISLEKTTEEITESIPSLDDKTVSDPQLQIISDAVTSAPVQPAPAPLTSATPQTQSLAQQDERGFIKSLLIKAQAKIQFNKQKKLDKIIQLAQKKQTITNDDVQKLLRVSDATATRYLVKLVEQGHLARVGSPSDAKYQFIR